MSMKLLSYKKMTQIYKKMSTWKKLLILLFFLFLVVQLVNSVKPQQENFSISHKKFETKHNDSLYDDFYANIYDKLFMNEKKAEMKLILNSIKPKNNSSFLDIGCGTGNATHVLYKNGYKVVGVDKSEAMIEKAKSKYPGIKFKQGDVMKSLLFTPNKFDNILCIYFTIYYIENKKLFFDNCYNWLRPGGTLVIHLVNRDDFDPIIPASDPLFLVSPQKYAKKRINKSIVKFNDFQYKAEFKLNKSNNKSTFEETFIFDKDGHVRKNIHTLHMETQQKILSYAKQQGFKMKGKINLNIIQYNYQYLYILQKPK